MANIELNGFTIPNPIDFLKELNSRRERNANIDEHHDRIPTSVEQQEIILKKVQSANRIPSPEEQFERIERARRIPSPEEQYIRLEQKFTKVAYGELQKMSELIAQQRDGKADKRDIVEHAQKLKGYGSLEEHGQKLAQVATMGIALNDLDGDRANKMLDRLDQAADRTAWSIYRADTSDITNRFHIQEPPRSSRSNIEPEPPVY